MSEWKNFTDYTPPLGKPLVSYVSSNYTEGTFTLITIGYSIAKLDNRNYPLPMNEKELKTLDGYWIELPPVPVSQNVD